MMILLLKKYWPQLGMALFAIGLCWWGYSAIFERGAASVQIQWDADKQATAAKSAQAAAAALATTQALSATIDTQRSQFHAQTQTLHTALASAVAGLRNRPARDLAGRVPTNPATGATSGATGADLLRQDSEFLVRESARADQLRLQLGQCQDQYNAARKALMGAQ